jgi:hypothetical protein
MYQERVGDALRQTIRQNQILRKFISWKNGALKLLWMTLKNPNLSFKTHVHAITRAYTTIPVRAVTAALTGISLSFSSFAFVTLNMERTDEVTIKRVASTK